MREKTTNRRLHLHLAFSPFWRHFAWLRRFSFCRCAHAFYFTSLLSPSCAVGSVLLIAAALKTGHFPFVCLLGSQRWRHRC